MQTWTNKHHVATPGPWADEPDKVQWVDPASDLDCLVVRTPLGHLCGYVGVPPGHPWHGKGYGEHIGESCGEPWCSHNPESEIDVHGGLTFAAACREGGHVSEGVCHVPLPGRPADVWWFGFDCAHAGDVSPGMREYAPSLYESDERYRTVPYVKSECERLAGQLALVGVPE